jgi:hypothetical protein
LTSCCWSSQCDFGWLGAGALLTAGLAGITRALAAGAGALEIADRPLALAARSRRCFSSHSGQMRCFVFDDLKLLPHWLHRIFILLIACTPYS